MVNENPRSPSDIWFGIGLCYYRLGNLTKAKLTLKQKIVTFTIHNTIIELSLENKMSEFLSYTFDKIRRIKTESAKVRPKIR